MVDILHTTLIIRFSSVGDIVLSSLLLRTLRARFPSLRLDYLVRDEYAGLVRFNPAVTGVIEFPRGGGIRALLGLRRTIVSARYDLIIDIHDSLRSRLLCLGLGRVVRVNKRKWARLLLVKFKTDRYTRSGGAPSVALRYLETVHDLGVTDDGVGLELFLPPGTAERAEAELCSVGWRPGTSLIGVAPSARHATKRWIPSRFAEVARRLAAERGAAVVLFGSTDEAALCAEVAAGITALHPDGTVLNVSGRLDLAGTAAVLDRCDVLITNDSGLMHIAAARKRRVVAVYGPTVRQFGFFPFGTESVVVEHDGLACRPCSHIGGERCPKEHFRCMKEIPAQRVLDAARTLLTH